MNVHKYTIIMLEVGPIAIGLFYLGLHLNPNTLVMVMNMLETLALKQNLGKCVAYVHKTTIMI